MSPSFEAQEDTHFQQEVAKVKEWWKVRPSKGLVAVVVCRGLNLLT